MADINNTFSHSFMREAIRPSKYYVKSGKRGTSSHFQTAKDLTESLIIVRLQYKSSEVEMNKLEVRTTITDKIANLGGTYGIWAELTGCSLLGIINLIIISCKLLLKCKF